MADNYLITGYWGEPHITPENDRGINAAMFGTGRFVLPVGQQFKAEYIGNNTIRMYDGKLIDNGAAAGIPAGEYVDLLIPEAGQGMKRNDLIVFQYQKDGSTLIESGRFVVVQGEETSGTATDPELTHQDLLSNEATFDQMPLYRVSVSGAEISTPIKLFGITASINLIWDKIYPIGSIYLSVTSTSPSVLFGGVWEQIKDAFILAAGDKYPAGTTGGEAEHTLTVDEMPMHNHIYQYTGQSNVNGTDKIKVVNSQDTANGYTGNPGYAGGNQPHNNMPPYLVAYCWKRIA